MLSAMLAQLKAMPSPMRTRYCTLLAIIVVVTIYLVSTPSSSPRRWAASIGHLPFPGQIQTLISRPQKPGKPTKSINATPAHKKPAYKPTPTAHYPPIKDPWPLLSQPNAEVPSVPKINRPKAKPEFLTPLFVGFTRSWPQLLQCVASYIAAGWPAEDIFVVENTGVMYANRQGKLGLQNPFYLNHTQLKMLGVNVIVTPTLLTFAQLQNYYAWIALERNWDDYFWSHQDVLAFSFENQTTTAEYESLYSKAVGVLKHMRQKGIPAWANVFFAYDHLALVHRDAILEVGGWDTHIPFYASDCDMYDRLFWADYWQGEIEIGMILDVATTLDDIGALFRTPGIPATFTPDPQASINEADGKSESKHRLHVSHHGETWERLVAVGQRMEALKGENRGARRNSWQGKQTGGKGEPFYRDPDGFDAGLQMIIDTGRKVFAEKWGHRGCDLLEMGIELGDAWRLERDWDPETEDALEGGAW